MLTGPTRPTHNNADPRMVAYLENEFHKPKTDYIIGVKLYSRFGKIKKSIVPNTGNFFDSHA